MRYYNVMQISKRGIDMSNRIGGKAVINQVQRKEAMFFMVLMVFFIVVTE